MRAIGEGTWAKRYGALREMPRSTAHWRTTDDVRTVQFSDAFSFEDSMYMLVDSFFKTVTCVFYSLDRLNTLPTSYSLQVSLQCSSSN